MKRLLDETTDDFTRALLVAGIEQRPPAGNKGKVLIALGAGSALGLFSSHALAWLGTSGGKMSLLGVALGVAGAVYAVAPWSETEAGRTSEVPAAAVASAREPSTVEATAVTPEVRDEAAGGGERVVGSSPTGELPAAAPASEPTSTLAARVRPAQARSKRDRAAQASSEARGDAPSPAAPPAAAAADDALESASLDAEVRLVDDMHRAARRNDDEALARFVATYHASFPDGQLKQEVSAFAARLDPAAKP